MLEELSDISMQAGMFTSSAGIEASRKLVRRARVGVGLLFLVNGAAVGSWVPHIPQRAAALHLNAAQLGYVLLAGGIGALCAMPFCGRLLLRFGSRGLSVASGLVFPAFLTAAILMGSIPLLVGVLFGTGIAAAAMDVAMTSHGVLVEALLRKRTVSLFHAIFSVGCFAGAGIQSFLMAQRVPDRILVPAFGACLLGMVAVAAPLLLDQALERKQQAAERALLGERAPRAHGPGASLRAKLPDPRLLLLGVLCFSTMVSEGAMGDWSALLLRVVHHLADGASGYGYTCFAGVMVLGRFTGDPVVAFLGEKQTLRLGGLCSAAGLLLVLLAHPLWVVLVGFAMAGAGLSNASPVLYRTAATMPGFAPGEGLATAVGVGYAGLLIGPPLLGLLGHAAGLPSIFWVLFSLGIVLASTASLVQWATRAAETDAGTA
jgi:MFS family permease